MRWLKYFFKKDEQVDMHGSIFKGDNLKVVIISAITVGLYTLLSSGLFTVPDEIINTVSFIDPTASSLLKVGNMVNDNDVLFSQRGAFLRMAFIPNLTKDFEGSYSSVCEALNRSIDDPESYEYIMSSSGGNISNLENSDKGNADRILKTVDCKSGEDWFTVSYTLPNGKSACLDNTRKLLEYGTVVGEKCIQIENI